MVLRIYAAGLSQEGERGLDGGGGGREAQCLADALERQVRFSL